MPKWAQRCWWRPATAVWALNTSADAWFAARGVPLEPQPASMTVPAARAKRRRRCSAPRGVQLDERDVDSDAAALAELKTVAGQSAIPVTVIAGTVIGGYDPERLRAAVEAARAVMFEVVDGHVLECASR
ncbi:MAG: glutaredoxin family protein [Myxococcaceae bacterium]|nr:glutaredoxin family protein [Myxococcaceae bacterium]